jgi:hypothetical protein
VQVSEVALPNKYATTAESWGIVYHMISTNRPRSAPMGAAVWVELSKIRSFELLGEAR